MKANEYHLVTFDPGGTIGWAHLVFDLKAFSRPEHKALAWLRRWDCGEFTGSEHEQLADAGRLIHRAHFGKPFNAARTDIVAEDFELTQMIGGKNLLSPVRVNAVLDWQCARQGLTLQYQRRSMRTNITPARLQLFGFDPPAGKHWSKAGAFKDAFAAMQHAVVWVRRQKELSRTRPWKLSVDGVANAAWDCACETIGTYGRSVCDMKHPI